MTIDHDNIAVEITSAKTYAYLDSAWVDISADVLQSSGHVWGGGMRGVKATDLTASSTPWRFTLDNSTGKYYPDGPNALTGWGDNVPVKLVVTYDQLEYQQYYGHAQIDNPQGADMHPNQARCVVTVQDWFHFANNQPIELPSIRRNKRIDEAATEIVGLSPIAPLATDFDEGATTFPAVFDAVRGQTTAYSELATLVASEWGHMFIKRRNTGETLTIENASRRSASATVVEMPTPNAGYWAREDGGHWLREDGGRWRRSEADTLGKITSAYKIPTIGYGRNLSNRGVVNAYPRRVDTDDVVLASTGQAIEIKAGQTINLKLRYIDPDGGGTRVNAIQDEMITPQAAGVVDTTLKTLLHFTDSDLVAPYNFIDSTGNHTWQYFETDVWREDPIYKDGYGNQWISNYVLGPWALFAGFSPYYMQTNSSPDFNFGSGAFTVGWYEARINVVAAQSTMSRDWNSSRPPWLFGKLNPTTKQMQIFMSSDGVNWDIANGRSMGIVKASRWVHYEISRDENGQFYSFADGKLQDTWYSDKAIPDSSAFLFLGLTESSQYVFAGFDEFYIYKGKCLHTKDFEPPQSEKSIFLNEDYWANTNQDRTGTDITSDITLSASYGTEAVSLEIKNTGASDGFIFVQTRGKGVYRYAQDERIIEDAASIAARGYRGPLQINQTYQANADAGATLMQSVIDAESQPVTEINQIEICGNRSGAYMIAGLWVEPGDLVQIEHAPSGADNYYWIQAVDKRLEQGGKFYFTWTLRRAFEKDV